jgi:DNA-binding transcriptional MerR regulator
MLDPVAKVQLPPIPAKRYFTIGEVSELCGVKPHVLRYWEQEFTQLKPVKRRGNRRYYQHHEVLLIRKIRDLLYEQGFTISGARNRLDGAEDRVEAVETTQVSVQVERIQSESANDVDFFTLRKELSEVIQLLRA